MSVNKSANSSHAFQGREVWFDADGARLFAVEVGEGHPVVFVHGGLADHRGALPHVAQLAGTQRVITPDVRGSGRSVYAGDLSWDRLADDLAALLKHLGAPRAIVGGTSTGSGVAVRFALRHPGLLQALILMSPLYPGADRPLSEPTMAAMRIMAEAGHRALEQGIGALRPLFETLPPARRDAAMKMLLGFDAASVAATTRFLATNQQPMQSVRELESIAVPVMVLPGIDPVHPADVASLYAEHLRHPTVVQQDAPDASEKLIRFCGALERPRDQREQGSGHTPGSPRPTGV